MEVNKTINELKKKVKNKKSKKNKKTITQEITPSFVQEHPLQLDHQA